MTPTDQLQPRYLQDPESRRLEFKERFSKGEQVVRTAVAFANGAGGRIVFGIQDEPRKVVGIPEEKLFSLEEKIISSIFIQCAPAIVPEIYIQATAGKTLLVVEIFPGSYKPYYLKKHGKHGGTYVRVGSSNRKASLESIEALERQQRKVSFDSLPVYDCPQEDVDLGSFKKAYRALTGKAIGITHLQNIGLLHPERDRVHTTHAALLLSRSPVRKRYFPYAKLECARFKGTTKKVFLDQATIDDPVHEAVEPCMAFIKKNIALGATIGEIYRQDRWEYPLEAVREALINAIIHRDYAILGSDIKVAIYDDMLEITSPGPLPDLLSFEDLGTGRSEIRNRVLAPIFKDMKLIEAWGSGIQKMHDELADYPEIELKLQEAGYAFQVQFIKKETLGTKRGPSRDQVGAKQDSEKQPESGQSQGRVKAESGQSQGRVKAESLKGRILSGLALKPLSKAEISAKLGMKGVPGHIHRMVRELLTKGRIEYTIPEKPNSRLQKYRLADEKKDEN
ncbi:MAG: putative DNA binding domain-containing protein [Deltaproteobacteria bacterium]|uniref:Putative DNA binding domain-containing protein n=1 Tax=Candidatus Desulfacyla euxinica TaxID=2841693 RepID=A0A8J6T745_9DELT|nr:putative DNA binding domain-containing protein [Candidatus Desulfacyla euxinica]